MPISLRTIENCKETHVHTKDDDQYIFKELQDIRQDLNRVIKAETANGTMRYATYYMRWQQTLKLSCQTSKEFLYETSVSWTK